MKLPLLGATRSPLALGVLLMLFVIALTMVQFRFVERRVHY